MALQILEIDKSNYKLFHQVAYSVYTGVEEYVFPLEYDIDAIFNQEINGAFTKGHAKRFVVIENEKPIGRIAAYFIGNKGGIGYLEAVDRQDVFEILVNTATKWLIANKVKDCQGLINFGEFNMFRGLQVDGNGEANYLENYHPEYYKERLQPFIEQKVNDRFTLLINEVKFNSKGFIRVAKWASKIPGYQYKNLKELGEQEFIAQLLIVYNRIWGQENCTFFILEEAVKYLKVLSKLINPNFFWIAFYENEPIGVLLVAPNTNSLVKGFHGKLNTYNKIQQWMRKNWSDADELSSLVFGVSKEHLNKGIELSLLFQFYRELYKYPAFKKVFLHWEGSYTNAIKNLVERMGATRVRQHAIYRFRLK